MKGRLDSGTNGLAGRDPSLSAVTIKLTEPLSNSIYRSLWIATIGANIGTCMKDVGSGWLMTSLSPSPLLVALVQAATMLPMALLALPAGALADIVNRRTLLIAAQLWGMTAAAILFVATLAGKIDALLLLGLTFVAACGSALSLPALQAVSSELVPRSHLPHTVTLAGISNNIARITGPAVGGLLIAQAGPAWVFLANCVAMLGIVWVLRRWAHKPPINRFPPEHLVGAIRAGFRYVHSSAELHSLMIRSIAFFICASSLWALLPLIARQQLGLGPAGYGLMITFIGMGALAAAASIHRLRRRLGTNPLSIYVSLLLGVSIAVVAITNNVMLALGSMFTAGFGWNTMTSNLQSTALLEAASWAKARAFGIFLMGFQGSMTLGAVLWGTLALEIGITNALLVSATLLVAGLILAAFYPLVIDPSRDFRPSHHWPDPVLEQPVKDDDGPVLITIEYEVDPTQNDEFVRRLHKLRAIRLRDGAMRWRYWRDVSHRSFIFETFIVASWLEHLRQHDRVTMADRVLQDAVNELHIGKSPPLVRHWMAIR